MPVANWAFAPEYFSHEDEESEHNGAQPRDDIYDVVLDSERSGQCVQPLWGQPAESKRTEHSGKVRDNQKQQSRCCGPVGLHERHAYPSRQRDFLPEPRIRPSYYAPPSTWPRQRTSGSSETSTATI